MKRNLLVTLANEDYVEQAKQLFSSAYFGGGWDGDFMLLAHGIPEEKLKDFRDKGILIKKCRLVLPKRINEGLHPLVLSKLYLFEKEFKKWGIVICLDSDVIIKKSLKNLEEIKGFSAVIDSGNLLREQFRSKNKKEERVIFEIERNYDLRGISFNCGFFCFNTSIIKKDSFKEIQGLLKKYKKVFKSSEQALLNLYFYKKWEELPVTYNCNPPYFINPFKTIRKLDLGVVWHFAGTVKPWQMSKKSFFYKEWKRGLERFKDIDLSRRNNFKGRLSEKVIENQSRLILKKYDFYRPHRFIDRYIGKVGIYLRKRFPKIYYTFRGNIK
jgi:lipopolysaccharide biosynthesis glycosyltransferase